MAEILFFAKLTRTSNCRASYDKLDCPFCKEILPDAHVAVTYGKNPLGISGHISYGLNDMIQHPFIPKARVHRGMVLGLLSIQDTIMQTLDDQIKLHPDFEVIVAGLDDHLTMLIGKPRVGDEHYVSYVADNNINLIRYHEGDEYWIKSFRHNEVGMLKKKTVVSNCI
ncbi:hypothetical protein BD560DRAFT_353606 [Blakeslea trispora]|nr:hypothetical protein BD560DRAFT_353606 [Blakeslea trispora]